MSAVDPLIHGDRHLTEKDVSPDPIKEFEVWFGKTEEAGLTQPEAVALATCTRDGKPSVRMVLLRGFDERGFVFFTNYNSRKSEEISENPYAALVFYWEPFSRQVRIEGRVEKTSADESDAYYRTRPRGSRIGAWASPQSEILGSRQELEDNVEEILSRYGTEGPVPRPHFWGGFRVVPDMIEFWQGRPDRLHDRIRYRREQEKWIIERLAP